MPSRVHHINFVVANLDAAIERYESILQQPVTRVDELPSRGARTARFRLGDLWLVLVQPTGPGVPADHLRERGEGFFLLSLAVGDVDAELERLAALGLVTENTLARPGLDGWRVADLDRKQTFGATLHLTEETETSKHPSQEADHDDRSTEPE